MTFNPMGNGVTQAQFGEYKRKMEYVVEQLAKRLEDLEQKVNPVQEEIPANDVTLTEEKKTTRKKKVEG